MFTRFARRRERRSSLAATQGAYKLIARAQFNIEHDPVETNDLPAKHAGTYRILRKRKLQLAEQRRKPETHTNIAQAISEPILVFGKKKRRSAILADSLREVTSGDQEETPTG